MKNAKHSELTKIATKYNMVYNQFIQNDQGNKNKDIHNELESINNLYNQTRKMPVWPFDLEIFVKFGAVFFSSILAYIGQLLINLIKQ